MKNSGEPVWELRSAITKSEFSDRIKMPYVAFRELETKFKNLEARRKYRGIDGVSSVEQALQLCFEKINEAMKTENRIFCLDKPFDDRGSRDDGLKIENDGDRLLAYAIKERNENVNCKVFFVTNDITLLKKSEKFNVQAINVQELQDLVVERYISRRQEHHSDEKSRLVDEELDSSPALNLEALSFSSQ